MINFVGWRCSPIADVKKEEERIRLNSPPEGSVGSALAANIGSFSELLLLFNIAKQNQIWPCDQMTMWSFLLPYY